VRFTAFENPTTMKYVTAMNAAPPIQTASAPQSAGGASGTCACLISGRYSVVAAGVSGGY
jgi:hypothetical protein